MKILKTLALIPAVFAFATIAQAAHMPQHMKITLPTSGTIVSNQIADKSLLELDYTYTTNPQTILCTASTVSPAKKVDHAKVVYTNASGDEQCFEFSDTNFFQFSFAANNPSAVVNAHLFAPTGKIFILNEGDRHGDKDKDKTDPDDFFLSCTVS